MENEITTALDIDCLKHQFKKLDIEYLYAKQYSEKCPFDFIINHVLTVLIISNEEDVDKIQLAIDERAIALSELISCIMFKDTSNSDNKSNYFVIPTADIRQDLKKLFFNIQNNKDKYKGYLNNYNNFLGLNALRIRKLGKGLKPINADILLTSLQNKIDSLGRNPKANELRKPSFQLYYKNFGSLNNALEILGYIPTRYRTSDKSLERKRLIKVLQDRCNALGRAPNSMEVKDSNTMMKYFGSWNQCLSAAGILDSKTFNRNDVFMKQYSRALNLAKTNDITPEMLEEMIKLIIFIKRN